MALAERFACWTTIERCDGTVTKVHSGTLRVRDGGTGKTVTVRAGQRYLASRFSSA